MKPDSTISAIRPSMMALVSTTMCGSPTARPSVVLVAARRKKPTASAAIRGPRAWRRSTRPCRDRGRSRRQAAGTVRTGRASPPSGRPSSRPISRPSRRPMMAVTNSAVESSSTWRRSHSAGSTVMWGRIPKPTIIQATVHSATRAPAASNWWNRPSPVVARTSPTEPPSRAPRTRMYRINGSLERLARLPPRART